MTNTTQKVKRVYLIISVILSAFLTTYYLIFLSLTFNLPIMIIVHYLISYLPIFSIIMMIYFIIKKGGKKIIILSGLNTAFLILSLIIPILPPILNALERQTITGFLISVIVLSYALYINQVLRKQAPPNY